ncbi:MAG: ATP-binding protein [Polyangiales bacterium]
MTSPSEPHNNGEPSKDLDEELIAMLRHLRLGRLLSHWDETVAKARKGRYSPERLLKYVLEEEYRAKRENARCQRRQRSNIPEMLEMETFPFPRQPKLDRKKIMSYYDSFEYITKRRNMVWLGPTGCGKSGLATAFLLHAIDRGYRGYFVTFPELLQELFQSLADRSEGKVLKRYLSYDCLVIDEVGYVEVEAAQVGQFFTLMHKRHKQKTTLITSNLGFSEWGSFLHNKHLTAALIDRLTENSHVINIKDGDSLRDKLDE